MRLPSLKFTTSSRRVFNNPRSATVSITLSDPKTTMLAATARSTLLCAPHMGASLAARALSSAGEPLVLVEKKDKYAVVRLNRPPVNSLNTAVRRQEEATEGSRSFQNSQYELTVPSIDCAYCS